MAEREHILTSSKARKILHDNSVRGHPLTKKQKRFFGAVAGGQKPLSQRAKNLRKKQT